MTNGNQPGAGDGSAARAHEAQPQAQSHAHSDHAPMLGGGTYIERLEGASNYNSWKFSMKMLLTLEGLWSFVTGDETCAARDARALARICLSVQSTCHQYVRDAKSSKQAWDCLAKIFEDRGLYRRVLLLRKLHHADLSNFSSMTEYIQHVMNLVQQLADIGKVIDDCEVAEILLSGLSQDYEALVSNLETVCITNTLSSELVRTRLLQEEFRRNSTDSANHGSNSATAFSVQKPKVICNFCKKPGHVKSKCFRWKKMQKKEKPDTRAFTATATAFFAGNTKDWYVDSGCSTHMCNDRSALTNFKDMNFNQSVTIANNDKLNITGVGEVNMKIGSMDDKNSQALKNCTACLEGKMSAKPYPLGQAHRAESPLELVHSDVCGPIQEASFGGAKYIVTFTDDFTRKSFGYLIKNKSEVMPSFINFKSLVEKQLGLPIKILRSDNGGEYCNQKFCEYLKSKGIIHQTSVAYCSQQNGVAERLNRILFEKVRCMLQGANLDKRYWGEAIMTAIYLKNRSPTSALGGMTPEEKWSGRKPDLSHLHTFGCIAYSLLPEQKRRKLDAKSQKYIFVGYSTTSKGFRLSDPHDPKRVITSRNVAFLEERFSSNNNNNSNIGSNNNDFISYDMTCNNNCDILLKSNNNNMNVNNVNNDIINLESNFEHPVISDDKHNCDLSSSSVPLSVSGSLEEEEVYNTGSENEASFAESPIANAFMENASSESGVTTAPEESASDLPPCSASRPVRSTRSKPPVRYADYEIDYGLLTQENIIVEPTTYDQAMSGPQAEQWRAAMQCEYDSLMENDVWKLVDRPPGENVIKSKWVFKTKYDTSGRFDKFKARLVARGFTQVPGVDFNDTFSPVVRHSTMRLLFSLATKLDLNIDHIDVNTAFLNGKLKEKIFMEPPPGFSSGDKVCLLQKGIYGLKQASRIWNDRVYELLSENGYKQSKCEPCVYTKKSENDMIIIALYVDDFYLFYSKDSKNIKDLLTLLESNFKIKHLGPLTSCLGMRVTRDRANRVLKLDQSEYIKKLLLRFGMQNCKPVSTPMVLNSKLYKCETESLQDDVYNYRELLGSLMYIAVCTRPDIAHTCSQLGQFSNCFDKNHWLAAKRVLRYLSGTIDYCLCFQNCKDMHINAFADADWGNNIVDRKS